MTERLNLTLDDSVVEKIRRQAAAKGLSLSDAANELLRDKPDILEPPPRREEPSDEEPENEGNNKGKGKGCWNCWLYRRGLSDWRDRDLLRKLNVPVPRNATAEDIKGWNPLD